MLWEFPCVGALWCWLLGALWCWGIVVSGGRHCGVGVVLGRCGVVAWGTVVLGVLHCGVGAFWCWGTLVLGHCGFGALGPAGVCYERGTLWCGHLWFGELLLACLLNVWCGLSF